MEQEKINKIEEEFKDILNNYKKEDIINLLSKRLVIKDKESFIKEFHDYFKN